MVNLYSRASATGILRDTASLQAKWPNILKFSTLIEQAELIDNARW